tara:strand:- start:7118 stop:7786 length:669 start_codon:yes stop_codon:yes gene_type:complete
MINSIKIYGERNSGTHYITQLLEQNTINIKLHSGNYKDITGWKHGYPKIDNYDTTTTLFIFLIRDLNSWLKSMYMNPWSYKNDMSIEEFLTNTLILDEERKDHDVHIYNQEQQNIIDLRYMKIKAYIECYSKVSNAIIINLSEIQSNYEIFLLNLNKNFNIKLNKQLENIIRHTKTHGKEQNRKYDIEIPYGITSNKINNNIELFVYNLKKGCKYKTISDSS